jgi:imidazole glycerol-phosphate synthase subunit HisH
VIDVIDYRAGNSHSVIYALERLELPCRLVAKPEEVAESDRLVLPGVGAAAATLDSLRESDLLDALGERVQRDKVPFLGICIGLQVLFEHSEEGNTECLGWLPGHVRRFTDQERVPQIGWNEVRFTRSHPVTAAVPDRGHFYFVNSYYADPRDATDALGRTEYGVEFASVVARDNVVATQFHAEKSGGLGLRLLESFASWDGRC